MGTLALDIETASPFEGVPFDGDDTNTLTWVAIALAYDDGDGSPDAAVLLRRGDWASEHTADLLDRFIDWCADRDIERTLTYNGASFDLRHMANWAADLAHTGVRPNAVTDLSQTIPHHVDLALAVADEHPDAVRPGRNVPADFIAYDRENIDNESIWYADYDFDPDYFEGFGIDGKRVQGKHVGEVLGERYVDGVTAGLEGTKMHETLTKLLTDYCYSDILDLFELYDSLGGRDLDDEYHRPIDEIER